MDVAWATNKACRYRKMSMRRPNPPVRQNFPGGRKHTLFFRYQLPAWEWKPKRRARVSVPSIHRGVRETHLFIAEGGCGELDSECVTMDIYMGVVNGISISTGQKGSRGTTYASWWLTVVICVFRDRQNKLRLPCGVTGGISFLRSPVRFLLGLHQVP